MSAWVTAVKPRVRVFTSGLGRIVYCGAEVNILNIRVRGGFDIVIHCELCREARHQIFIFHLEVSQGSKVYHSHWGGLANLNRSTRGIFILHNPMGID